MLATEAKYHTKCLVSLHNRARLLTFPAATDTTDPLVDLDGLVFAERIAHIDETLHVEGYDRGIDTFYPTKSSTSKKTAQLTLNYSKVPPLTLAKNEEQDWLENTKHESAVISLLPMFTENVHSLAMIAHSMRVIKAVVQHVTPSQTPIFAVNQPLFALVKEIQG